MNLPRSCTDEALWEAFGSVGEIVNVRVVRDGRTGLGKGIGYVSFKERGAVPLALLLSGTKLAGGAGEAARPMRVERCTRPEEKKAAGAGADAKGGARAGARAGRAAGPKRARATERRGGPETRR